MRNLLVVGVLLFGCGKKKGDDCQQLFDKMKPVLESMGKPITGDDQGKMLDKCRKDDKFKSDPMAKCILGASSDDAVKACMAQGFGDYAKKSKKTEAQLQLNKLGKNAKVYWLTNSKFPPGTAKTMPDKPCCPDKCAVSSAWASDPVWSSLDFQIDEPNLFQYTYTAKGDNEAEATAIGDLDCDGVAITYTLKLTAANGNPEMTITEPPANTD